MFGIVRGPLPVGAVIQTGIDSTEPFQVTLSDLRVAVAIIAPDHRVLFATDERSTPLLIILIPSDLFRLHPDRALDMDPAYIVHVCSFPSIIVCDTHQRFILV